VLPVGRDKSDYRSLKPVVLHNGARGGKRPERVTRDGKQCHGGMLEWSEVCWLRGEVNVGNLRRQVVDHSREVLVGTHNVNARLTGGAE